MNGSTLSNLTDASTLARTITGAAYNLSFEYGADVEDIRSEIVLAILERYTEDPEFLAQADSYIVRFGAWRARNELNRECRSFYNQIEEDDPVFEDGTTVLEMVPDSRSWEDVEFSFELRLALETLAERDQQICKMVGGGWNADEIAREVECGRRTVYYRLQNPIRTAVAAQIFV